MLEWFDYYCLAHIFECVLLQTVSLLIHLKRPSIAMPLISRESQCRILWFRGLERAWQIIGQQPQYWWHYLGLGIFPNHVTVMVYQGPLLKVVIFCRGYW